MSKILISPLDWGLGHATRCVPLIRDFIKRGDEVIIATDGFPLQFLRNEFPQLRFEIIASYKVTYSTGKSQVGAMLRNLPRIVAGVFREHRWLHNYLKNNEIDIIISDNRFGLWARGTSCIYITHQLMIKMPVNLKFMETLVWRAHRWFINHYDKCWIPDFADVTKNLSGDLSHKYPLPKHAIFINPLSRFSGQIVTPNTYYHTVCVLSGVEPQRSALEKDLLRQFENSAERVLIVRGKPQEKICTYQTGNVTVASHLDSPTLAEFLTGAQKIICRAGYSSIMDLMVLGCLAKATLIPTPGQTEQEYLAEYLAKQAIGKWV
ncbi:MAG: hypothetical protein LBB41_05455 [Prevotellaceae bacterium]|jgi:uncharacterized protein (TIGR00661 family)|nr:hypothetical protein [Prevotellaceae bacterium]